ncbi:MAG: hypothetical protein V1649_00830 [Patescibacteria group bacterium]
MAEINFLSNKKDQEKVQPKKTDDVLLSKVAIDSQKSNKKNVFGWLNFVDKNKNIKKTENNLIDKTKIKHSREEVLKLIKQNEKQPLLIKQKHEDKPSEPSVFRAWLKSIFNKKVQKNILKEKFTAPFYQRGEIKEKKNSAKPTIPVKPLKISFSEVKAEAMIKEIDFLKIKPVEEIKAITEIKSKEIKKEKIIEPVIIKKQEETIVKEFKQWKNPDIMETNLIKAEEIKAITEIKSKEIKKDKIIEPVIIKKQEETIVKEFKQWKNPDIMETNLIKNEIIAYFDWKGKISVLINVIILSCSLVGIVYGGLLFWQKQKAGDVGDKEALIEKNITLEAQTAQTEKDIKEIIIFQNKLKAVGILLNNHTYWTNFFKFLEDNTIADVFYAGFSGDTNGKYTFGAMARNYASISRQINTMKANSDVISVKADGGKIAGRGEASGVNFSLNLEINPNIFIK